MITPTPAVLLLLCAAACPSPQAEPSLVMLLPAVVELTEDVLCGEVTLGAECGPLYVDVESVAAAIERSPDAPAGLDVDSASVAAAMDRQFAVLATTEAHACAPERMPCEILHDGIHLRLDEIGRTDVGLSVVFSATWVGGASAKVAGSPGWHRFGMELEPDGDGWRIERVRLLAAI